MKKIVALGAALFSATPLSVQAKGMKAFIPRFANFYGELVGEMEYTRDKDSNKLAVGRTVETVQKKRKLRESFHVSSVGFVYHPDLFVFSVDGSGELERQRNTLNSHASTTEDAHETYQVAGEFLRRKRYGLTFTSSLERPFLASSSLRGTKVTKITTNEIKAAYENLPWWCNITYKNKKTETEEDLSTDPTVLETQENTESLSDVWMDVLYNQTNKFRLGVSGRYGENKRDQNHYYKEISSSEDALYTSKAEKDKTQVYSMNNFWRLKSAELTNVAVWDTNRSSDEKKNKIFLDQRTKIPLPWGLEFQSKISHDKRREKKSEQNGSGSLEKRRLDIFEASFDQKLFESLVSTLSTKYRDIASSGGGAREVSHDLSTHYVKRLHGGELRGGLSTSIQQVDRKGIFDVREEEHPGVLLTAFVGGTFPLLQVDTNPDTIYVEVKDSSSSEWVSLSRCADTASSCTSSGEEWSVGPLNGSVLTIQIEPGFLLNTTSSGPGLYDFRVTYSSNQADYVLQTNDYDFTMGVTLLSGMIGGNYLHSFTSQEVIEGDVNVAGELSPEVTEDLWSLWVRRGPFSVWGDYRLIASDYDETKLRYGGNFFQQVTFVPKLQTSVSAQYQKAEVDANNSGGEDYTDSEYTLTGLLANTLSLKFWKIPIRLHHFLGYEKETEKVTSFNQGAYNIYAATQGSGDATDKYYNEVGADLRVPTPWKGLAVQGRFRYRIDEHASGKQEVRQIYDISSDYKWRFGATTLSLEGDYSLDDNTVHNGSNETQSIEEELKIYLKLTRRIF